MRYVLMSLLALWLLVAGCNVAKDTEQTTKEGGKGAVGLAEKMKGGTVGGANEETGDTAQEQSGE